MPILFLVSLFAALAYPQWPIDHHLRGTNVVPEISTQDLAFLASNWKANSVRVLDVSLMDTKTHAIDEAHLEKYFRAVDQVLANGMFAILGLGTATEDHDGFFGSASYREAYKTLLVRIANRYAKDTRSLAYDLLNEPHDSAAKTQWSAYATELAHAIRAVDTSHTLIVEPPEWGWPAGFEEFKPIDEKDVVYS
ncbi:MAG: glycoside hydrolase family 5 protein, partial [Bdellovibrionota bacterium]